MTNSRNRIASGRLLSLVAFVALSASACFATEANQTRPQSQPDGAMARMERFTLVYVVRYRPGPAYRSDMPLLQQDLVEHGKYMRDQTLAGIIIAAGPTFDQGGGLVLLHVADLATAQAFVRRDPAVIAGIFVGEITDWRPVYDAKSIFRRDSQLDQPAAR